MNPAARLAHEELEFARAMAGRLERESQIFAATLDPKRAVVDPTELRLGNEHGEWILKIYAAEHALFMAENGTPGIVGVHGEYRWLTSVDHDICTLLRLCPEVLLDKYLAVTSRDSGVLHLNEQDTNSGWWTADAGRVYLGLPPDGTRQDRADCRIAYSPRLTSIHGLPDETRGACGGFDEWYVFDQPVTPGEIEVFVNWMGFRLYDPVWKWTIDRFWEQMTKLAPESYLADGTVFTFATRNGGVFKSVLAAFSA